jgi:hypothetical protein
MYAIIQLIRADEFKHITLQGFDEIGQQLRMHRMTFMRNLAMFGGLLGGSPARFVAKLLARDACHKEDAGDVQYSLIHFLMPDGRIPGSWSSDAEDRFRADIKKHYDKLGD